jgi:hypothetical protein
VFAALFRRGGVWLVTAWLRSANAQERRRVRVGARAIEIGYAPVVMTVPQPPARIVANG